MSGEGPFRSRTVVVLVGIVGVSFLAFLLLLLFGEEIVETRSGGADTFSRSAIGHRALVEVLERLDVPVVVSRHASERKVRESGVLVVAEPPPWRLEEDDGEAKRLRRMLDAAPRSLIVLPKRRGMPNEEGWIVASSDYGEDEVRHVLDALDVAAHVVQPVSGRWTMNLYDAEPEIDEPQLIQGDVLVPLIASPNGILLAEVRGGPGRRLLLSDPDLLATHGLHGGENACLLVAILDDLREDGPVVIDETLHGHGVSRTSFSELFRFPLVLVMLHAIAVLVLLGWAALGRFGAPDREPPVRPAGNEALVASTAEMLLRGGHASHVLRRYLEAAIRDAAEALHAPRDLDKEGRFKWLEKIGQSRGVDLTPSSLRSELAVVAGVRRTDAARLLRLARRIHQWKTEILDAPARRRSLPR